MIEANSKSEEGKNPDAQVAATILAEFQKEGLLSDEEMKGLEQKLIAGNISAADWKLVFESTLLKRGQE